MGTDKGGRRMKMRKKNEARMNEEVIAWCR